MPGSVILLNGASSSGKSTLARATQARLPVPFWHYSIDDLIRAEVLPQGRIDGGEFPWSGLRNSFFEGFHRSIAAIAEAGNNLLVEHIIETREWMDRLIRLLSGYDVFTVGLHCPPPELERREAARGNRGIGEARADFQIAHLHCEYDKGCALASPTPADFMSESASGRTAVPFAATCLRPAPARRSAA